MKTISLLIGASVAAALFASTAQAAVTYYGSEAGLAAQGTITQSFDFDAFDEGSFSFPGDPYSVGDVTFTSTNNLIVGAGLYDAGRNALANNFWTPLPGTIGGAHNLFGFNLTLGGNFSQIDVTVTTNQGSYTFADVSPSYSDGTFSFQGFEATGAGEFFTGFEIVALAGGGSLPLTTDYRLGTSGDVGAVPEPATWALMIGGFGLAGSALRRRRAATA